MHQTYSLHKATFTYTSHILVSASLWIATPTDPSRCLFVYCEYALLGTYNALLTQFLSVFHSLIIRVTSGGLLVGHPGQQLWLGFNADTHTHIHTHKGKVLSSRYTAISTQFWCTSTGMPGTTQALEPCAANPRTNNPQEDCPGLTDRGFRIHSYTMTSHC